MREPRFVSLRVDADEVAEVGTMCEGLCAAGCDREVKSLGEAGRKRLPKTTWPSRGGLMTKGGNTDDIATCAYDIELLQLLTYSYDSCHEAPFSHVPSPELLAVNPSF